jgi:hypothetical protein
VAHSRLGVGRIRMGQGLDFEPDDFIPFLVLGLAGGPLLPVAWEACRWTERERDKPDA